MTGMQCSGRVPVRVGKDPSPSLEPGSLAPHWEPGSTSGQTEQRDVQERSEP